MTGSVGLGLAIAKMLSDEMECELTYERADGETRFVLSLLRATEGLAWEPEFVMDSQASANTGNRRLGGVASSFAGNGRGAERSDTLPAGESRSGP